MRRIRKRITTFQCSVCKTEYEKAGEAKKCEKRTLEEKQFAIGDTVSSIALRTCSAKSSPYRFKGKIVQILGPMASDYQYEVGWLEAISERINGHVFQYVVGFKCPRCKENRQEAYYAPELKRLERTS